MIIILVLGRVFLIAKAAFSLYKYPVDASALIFADSEFLNREIYSSKESTPQLGTK